MSIQNYEIYLRYECARAINFVSPMSMPTINRDAILMVARYPLIQNDNLHTRLIIPSFAATWQSSRNRWWADYHNDKNSTLWLFKVCHSLSPSKLLHYPVHWLRSFTGHADLLFWELPKGTLIPTPPDASLLLLQGPKPALVHAKQTMPLIRIYGRWKQQISKQ